MTDLTTVEFSDELAAAYALFQENKKIIRDQAYDVDEPGYRTEQRQCQYTSIQKFSTTIAAMASGRTYSFLNTTLDEKLETLLNIVYPQPFGESLVPPPNFMADKTPLTNACQGVATAILCLFPELTEKVESPQALSNMVDEMTIANIEQHEAKLRKRNEGRQCDVLDKLDIARVRLGRVPPVEVEKEVFQLEDPAIDVHAEVVNDSVPLGATALFLRGQDVEY